MPIPGNIPGNPGMEEFVPVFPGISFSGNTRSPKSEQNSMSFVINEADCTYQGTICHSILTNP